jgi:hypothetical protein
MKALLHRLELSPLRFILQTLTLALMATTAQASTGPEVAQLLNRNFQFTAADCPDNHAAWVCSGVLARSSPATGEFWKHDALSSQLGAESFAYLRADLGTRSLGKPNGILFSDGFTAISQGKTLDALCAYPFELPLQGTRPDFGCGETAAANAAMDPGSCAALGVNDSAGWLEHFRQQNLQPIAQCSLSSLQPGSFKSSLTAHEGIDDSWSIRPTQVQVRNWDANAPRQLPILGLFYDVTQKGALLAAQKDQHDFFKATGDWLPILRMNLNHPDGVFGFNQQDQLYIGYQVAAQLNARYMNTSPTCQGGKTAFYCNGVLLRGTQASSAFHMWNPSPGSVANNGVSFTYLRKDAGLSKPVYQQGFIIRESFAPASIPLTVRCAYPFDGATSVATQDTCRLRSQMCDELGITSVQAWVNRYAANPRSSCAFNIDPAQFQLNIDVRPSVPSGDGWNEVMIQTWPQNIPLQIPLQVFYYSLKGHYSSNGFLQAQFGQRDYFQTTERFLPVVKLDLEASNGQVFSYNPDDQNAPGAPASGLMTPANDF